MRLDCGLAVRGSDDAYPRAAGRQVERPSDDRRGADRDARHRQDVAGAKRASTERSHVADEVRGAAAERHGQVETTADRQRRPRASSACAERQARTGRDYERLVERRRDAIDGARDLGSSSRARQVAVGDELRAEERDLERGRFRIIAEHLVCEPMRIPIHRSRHGNSQALVPSPSGVLHRRQHAGLDDGQ